MKKLIISAVLILFMMIQIDAQVEFKLTLLSDQETFLVSLVPDQTIVPPYNIASNIQVVLKVSSDQPFLAGALTSLVEGVEWIDNAYTDQSNQGEDYALCAFVMVQSMTKNLVFEEGVEFPLFSFKNLDAVCTDGIALPANHSFEVSNAVASGFNFTQNISLLATGGNAYSGVLNEVAECNNVSTGVLESHIVDELKAYPIPAHNYLNIEWNNSKPYEELRLELFNITGQLLQTIELDPSLGSKKIQLDIEEYTAGLYTFRLAVDKAGHELFKFIITRL